jgi:predicted RNase H-like HicB family nuclease
MNMKFKVVVHPEPEGGFWGEVPALPGCYSQGETVAELMSNLREAALGYLEVMREEGRQPQPEIEVTELAL